MPKKKNRSPAILIANDNWRIKNGPENAADTNDGFYLHTENATGNVPQRKSKSFYTEYTKYSNELEKAFGDESEFFTVKFSKEMGFGVYAKKEIKKKDNKDVKHILVGWALRTDEYDKSKGNWCNVCTNKKEGIKVLTGPISFVNHSCKKHANSKMVKQQNTYGKKDEILKKYHVEMIRKINEDDAITFSYGQGKNGVCSQCDRHNK